VEGSLLPDCRSPTGIPGRQQDTLHQGRNFAETVHYPLDN
jgi:hypothetical protein